MNNAIILHGVGDGPRAFWYPWLAGGLTKRGYRVWAPQMPSADTAALSTQLPFVLKRGTFTRDTVLVGHSTGAALILSVLERIPVRVRLAVLVAGFARPLPKTANAILQKHYNWKRIKAHAEHFIFINSDNDPWGCDDRQGRYLFDRLGGDLIIRHGEGHMGSNKYQQPYREFPFLLSLIMSQARTLSATR